MKNVINTNVPFFKVIPNDDTSNVTQIVIVYMIFDSYGNDQSDWVYTRINTGTNSNLDGRSFVLTVFLNHLNNVSNGFDFPLNSDVNTNIDQTTAPKIVCVLVDVKIKVKINPKELVVSRVLVFKTTVNKNVVDTHL